MGYDEAQGRLAGQYAERSLMLRRLLLPLLAMSMPVHAATLHQCATDGKPRYVVNDQARWITGDIIHADGGSKL